MKNRILAMLLVLVMILGLLPVSAFAAAPTLSEYFEGLPVDAETEPGAPSSTKKWKVTELNGEQVLVSGNQDKNSTTSTLQLTFTEDAKLTFEYKVSSEKNYDKCNITLNETSLVKDASGEVDWTGLEVDGKKGNVLKIVYSKDSSSSGGKDCVYLRNFAAGEPLVVTFHANNGTADTVRQNIFGGKGTLKANTFTCEGKLFAGWAATADGPVVYQDRDSITLTENVDLYAVWADTFTVSFVNDGKTTTVLVPQNTAIGSRMPQSPTKDGYAFEGWFHDDEQLTAETVITADVTYTAKWTAARYTIAFNPGDGQGTMDSIPAVYGEWVKLPKMTFTNPGYDFNGWHIYAGASYGIYDDEGFVKNLASEDGATATLYATWRGQAVPITIHYNYEGAQDVTRTGAVGKNYNYVKTEKGAMYDELTDPTRTGYIFSGWFDAAEGGNAYTNQYSFTPQDAENGVHMYAHWTKGITVHFDGNGYKSTLADKVVTPDKVYSSLPYLSSYYYPTQKALDGWYVKNADGSFGELVTKDTVFTGDEVTLIAKWRDYQYIIKYNVKSSDRTGVTGTMADQAAPFGQDVVLNACAYQKEGCVFAGWAESSYNSTVKYADGATINRPFEEDDWGDGSEDNEPYNLYACWTEVQDPGKQEAKEKLDAANKAISGVYNPVYGKDTNALTMITAKLTAAGITDVTVTMKEAAYNSYYNVGITADGTLQYRWNPNGSTPSTTAAVRPTLILTYGEYTQESTDCLFNMGLDEAKAMEALRAVAARITVPETVNAPSDLTKLPHYPVKAGVDESTVDYNESDDLELWATATWTSSNTGVIAITPVSSPFFAPYRVTVNQPKEDSRVVLTLTLTYSGRDDLYLKVTYDVTVTRDNTPKPLDYQAALESALREVGLTDPRTDTAIDYDNVTTDIQFPNTRDVGRIVARDYNQDFDGKYTPIRITSSNLDVISPNGGLNAARVTTYRPLPGQEPAVVTITVQILDRPSGSGEPTGVLATKDLALTVQPLTQEELDAAAAFMKKVCTEEVYWEGIRNGNTDKNQVTTNLHSFFEIVPDGDSYKFIRNMDDFEWRGVEADDIPGWELSEKYRCFRSSNPSVITHENLLVSQPKYNTKVTIDSILTYTLYGRYYEKFGSDPAYAQFAQFYQQPVSVTVTVIGTEGIEDPDIQPVNVTVHVEGSAFDETFTDLKNQTYSCLTGDHRTAADALFAVLAENDYTYTGTASYVTGIGMPGSAVLAAGDPAHGPWSGWMFTVNGEMPIQGTDPKTGETLYCTLDTYQLQKDDVIRVYYVNCPTETGDHSWDNGVVTTEPTYTREGVKTYTCTVCSATRTESIAKLEHCDGGEGCPSHGFVDVNPDSWYHEAVDYVLIHDLFKGTGETTFEPGAPMTRGMMVTVLWRVAGEPEAKTASGFTDVAEGWYYTQAIAWAKENGIVNGTSETTFAPDAPIAREQMAAILYRYAKYARTDVSAHGDLSAFPDGGRVSPYAVEAMTWAVEHGFITGSLEDDGSICLVPQNAAIRAQAAAIFMRFCQSGN